MLGVVGDSSTVEETEGTIGVGAFIGDEVESPHVGESAMEGTGDVDGADFDRRRWVRLAVVAMRVARGRVL